MSNQSTITATNRLEVSRPARKAQPSPFIGAASIVLGTGSVVFGLIGRALKGSVKLLLKSANSRRRIEPRSKSVSVTPDAQTR